MERRGASKKNPPPFLTLCQTPEDHISKKAWVAFGGPLSLFSLARRPCYSISIVCMLRSAQLDCIVLNSLLYKNKLGYLVAFIFKF